MPASRSRSFVLQLAMLAKACAVIAGLGAGIILLGWLTDDDGLKRLGVGTLTMKANTAVALLFASVGVWAAAHPDGPGPRLRIAGCVGGMGCSVIAVLVLVQAITGVDLGINEALVRDPDGDTPYSSPGLMAPNSAIGLLAIGVGSMLLAFGYVAPGHVCVLLAAVVALPAISAHAIASETIAGLPGSVKMAGSTAVCLSLLTVGLACARCDGGLLARLAMPGPAGIVARLLLPAVIILPIFIGWARWYGESRGWYGTEFGIVMMTTLMAVLLSALVWSVSQILEHMDAVQRAAEAEIRASHARLDAVLASSVDAIAAVDQSWNLIACNAAFSDPLTGTAGSKIAIGDHLRPMLEPPYMEAVQPSLDGWTSALAGVIHRDTTSIGTNQSRWVDRVFTPIRSPDGALIGAVLVQRDISERVAAEAAILAQRMDLERSNAELRQFASVASHDLQEPLRMVASYCTMLGDRYRGQLSADADEIIGFAVDGARRMQSLIHDLLEYTRVGHQLQRVRVPLDDALDDASSALRKSIDDSGCRLERDILPNVIGDRRHLAQLLQNLIGNAIKYRSDAPLVVRVAAERADDSWMISITDNGIGIDPRHHERVFGMFKRLHGRDRYDGTGIGLAICRKIVELHEGKIGVRSEKGRGSTFWFTISDQPAEEVASDD